MAISRCYWPLVFCIINVICIDHSIKNEFSHAKFHFWRRIWNQKHLILTNKHNFKKYYRLTIGELLIFATKGNIKWLFWWNNLGLLIWVGTYTKNSNEANTTERDPMRFVCTNWPTWYYEGHQSGHSFKMCIATSICFQPSAFIIIIFAWVGNFHEYSKYLSDTGTDYLIKVYIKADLSESKGNFFV